MKLTLTNGYPYPYPDGLSDEEADDISEAAGGIALVLHGVKHFQWLHTVTVEFENWYYLYAADTATGWKTWDNGLVLEAPISAADGYGHPAIIVGDTAYCGLILGEE